MLLYSRVCRSNNTVPRTRAVCSVSWFPIFDFLPDTGVWRRTRTSCGPSDGIAARGTDSEGRQQRRLCYCSPALCIPRVCRRPAAHFPIWCTCCRGSENWSTVLPPSRQILWRKEKTKYYVNNDKLRLHEK